MARFRLDTGDPAASAGELILTPSRWNDWFLYRTLFHVSLVLENGRREFIGALKIADLQHQYANTDEGATQLPPTFDALGPDYVSVGQNAEFYINLLSSLGRDQAQDALRCLNDASTDLELFDRVRAVPVVADSLMRSVSASSVEGQFNRIATGGDARIAYDLAYKARTQNPFDDPICMDFSVLPGSNPPSNVHVVIGRNGAGKTSLLQTIGNLVLGRPSGSSAVDPEFGAGTGTGGGSPAGLVYVSFSAFDRTAQMPVKDSGEAAVFPYAYIGLQQIRTSADQEVVGVKSPDDLAESFAKSAANIHRSGLSETWRTALEVLASDPNFAEAQVQDWATPSEGFDDAQLYERGVSARFRDNLSSGHKIVLLTITRLVETVSEKTLVLLDEPEGHLHPPLLSAFIRALSELMSSKNGLAIIATHSPVLLQEVPARCVWRLVKTEDSLRAERPSIETFGENVGVLTTEVFGLEVAQSGFMRRLEEVARQAGTYEEALQRFDSDLGVEARGLLRSLYLERSHS